MKRHLRVFSGCCAFWCLPLFVLKTNRAVGGCPCLPLLDCCGTPASLAMCEAVREHYGIEVKLNHSCNDVKLQLHIQILWQETKNTINNTNIFIYLVMFYYIAPNFFLEVNYKSYASMKTLTQKGTHRCTHTNIHTHDPVRTHTLTFHLYDPLPKPRELVPICIFSQHQTNWKFFWKQTPITQTIAP